jgi:hypothetical protein
MRLINQVPVLQALLAAVAALEAGPLFAGIAA